MTTTATPTYGRKYETTAGQVTTETWHYALDAEGKETGYLIRVSGRPVVDVARDLADALVATRSMYGDETEESSLIDEYTALGHEYQYTVSRCKDTPVTWPPNSSVECSAVRGGSEGHYVHIDLVPAICELDQRRQHIRILTVKTFRGFAHAWKIAARATELLGFGD